VCDPTHATSCGSTCDACRESESRVRSRRRRAPRPAGRHGQGWPIVRVGGPRGPGRCPERTGPMAAGPMAAGPTELVENEC
jgi:hypothetical protein